MGQETPLTFADADADHKDARYANGVGDPRREDGLEDVEPQPTGHARPRSGCSIEPVQLAEGDQLDRDASRATSVGCVRLALSPFGRLSPRLTDDRSSSSPRRSRPRRTIADDGAGRTVARRTTCSAPAGTPEALARFRTLQAERARMPRRPRV